MVFNGYDYVFGCNLCRSGCPAIGSNVMHKSNLGQKTDETLTDVDVIYMGDIRRI